MTDYVIVDKEWLENLRNTLLNHIYFSEKREETMQNISDIIGTRLGLLDITENTGIAHVNHAVLQEIMWNYAIPDMVSDYVQGDLNDKDYISESEHSLKVLFASLYGLDYEGKDAYEGFTTLKLNRKERNQIAKRITEQYEVLSKK